MNAAEIKQCVAAYYTDKLWAVHFEVGLCKWGRLRADVLAMSMGSQIVVIETKSSVADFRSDKKFHKYAKYADKLYLAFAKDIYEKVKHDIPKGVGVFVVDPVSGRAVIEVAARGFKPVAPAIRLNVVTRMAYRSADKTRHMRKSKTAGAELVAATAVEAIRAIPKDQRKGNKRFVIQQVAKAIGRYV